MSQRSIIEINHDFSHVIRQDGYRFFWLLLRALASGSDESWEPLRSFGVLRITQCHHSEDRKLIVGATKREYTWG